MSKNIIGGLQFQLNADEFRFIPTDWTFSNAGGWLYLISALVVLLFIIVCALNTVQYFKISQTVINARIPGNQDNKDFISDSQANAFGIMNIIIGICFVFVAIFLLWRTFKIKNIRATEEAVYAEDVRKFLQTQVKTYKDEKEAEYDSRRQERIKAANTEVELRILSEKIISDEATLANYQTSLRKNTSELETLRKYSNPSDEVVSQIASLEDTINSRKATIEKLQKEITAKKIKIHGEEKLKEINDDEKVTKEAREARLAEIKKKAPAAVPAASAAGAAASAAVPAAVPAAGAAAAASAAVPAAGTGAAAGAAGTAAGAGAASAAVPAAGTGAAVPAAGAAGTGAAVPAAGAAGTGAAVPAAGTGAAGGTAVQLSLTDDDRKAIKEVLTKYISMPRGKERTKLREDLNTKYINYKDYGALVTNPLQQRNTGTTVQLPQAARALSPVLEGGEGEGEGEGEGAADAAAVQTAAPSQQAATDATVPQAAVDATTDATVPQVPQVAVDAATVPQVAVDAATAPQAATARVVAGGAGGAGGAVAPPSPVGQTPRGGAPQGKGKKKKRK
jgi:hypothetical protein